MSARIGMLGAALVVTGAVLLGAGAVSGGMAGYRVDGIGMMGGGRAGGMMGGRTHPGPMMGGGRAGGMMGGAFAPSAPGPGEVGFVAGTQASPRVVKVVAGPGYTFTPSAITVAKGETIIFEVTSMGGLVHEFMVGPADAVAADAEGTPEVADIGMMQTRSLTYTFDGGGPYAFACHVAGHYEAGMKGIITVVG